MLGTHSKSHIFHERRRRPGRSGFKRGVIKRRRPTGGRLTMVGLSVTGELADLWSINATGGANTLLEEGDKVLAHYFHDPSGAAALLAGVIAEVRVEICA